MLFPRLRSRPPASPDISRRGRFFVSTPSAGSVDDFGSSAASVWEVSFSGLLYVRTENMLNETTITHSSEDILDSG
jgi:hypothetical protein